MIRIRYADITSGLHGKVEDAAGGTIVYLLPGLSAGQRKAALRRLRQEANRGCGPALPLVQLMLALAVDRLRVGVHRALAIVRLHPAGSLAPAIAIGGGIVLFVLASVSVRIVHRPDANAYGGTPTVSAGGPPAGVPALGGRKGMDGRIGRSGGANARVSPGAGGLSGRTATSATGSLAATSSKAEPSRSASSSSGSDPSPASSGNQGTGSGSGAGSGSGRSGSQSPASVSVSTGVSAVSASVGVAAGKSGASAGVSAGGGGTAGNSSSVAICVNVGPLGGCLGL